jgi:hypothetical protein
MLGTTWGSRRLSSGLPAPANIRDASAANTRRLDILRFRRSSPLPTATKGLTSHGASSVGVTSFIHNLEISFLNQLDGKEIPGHLDPNDGLGVAAWFHEAFGIWFLNHRDDVLAKEWARRGWAEWSLQPAKSGELKETYQVKPECAQQIDDWLQDQIE